MPGKPVLSRLVLSYDLNLRNDSVSAQNVYLFCFPYEQWNINGNETINRILVLYIVFLSYKKFVISKLVHFGCNLNGSNILVLFKMTVKAILSVPSFQIMFI